MWQTPKRFGEMSLDEHFLQVCGWGVGGCGGVWEGVGGVRVHDKERKASPLTP